MKALREKQGLESKKINPQSTSIDPEIQKKIKVLEGRLKTAMKLTHRNLYHKQDMEVMNNELIEFKAKVGLEAKGLKNKRILEYLIWTKKDIKRVEKDIKKHEKYMESPRCKRQNPETYNAYIKVINRYIAEWRTKIDKDKVIIQLKKDNKLNFSTKMHNFLGSKSKSKEDHQIVGVNKADVSKRVKKELVQSKVKLAEQHPKLDSTKSRVQENKEDQSFKYDLSRLTKSSVVSNKQSDKANNTLIGKHNEVKKGRVGSRINNRNTSEIQSIHRKIR